ncbi:acetyl-CoA hydrolase/transferase family protein [Flammeovirga kamogawensis]|uniref:4-hydroxybutyrate CoA-transferase n=1 Tax=Flammeovirga kamogawensis TaxID=373891 RepID=A0ABX8GX70_9BACT|nr:acetyl-CoA hydrolase/transferase C-terminal domain-containing protein [Flammeovirga kamogawensis]MBB6460851.1 acyl-CoA hydrolase [Flammeovirga kamogawensis]QWG08200.1 4-hydroxybutyrate CoA-transferase [Flammeovirga kamogawensis]TRX70003.1 acetyl-CoA hydrolase/transferase family protein [Flammeovirga kamogawensis]
MATKYVSADEAVKIIKSGDRVCIQGGAATPQALTIAMTARANELRDVEIVHLHTEGYAGYAEEQYTESFKTNCFFIGGNVRKQVWAGNAQYIPVFLSDIPNLFRRDVLPLDVVMVNVSTPDKHGYCSLGVSVDIIVAAIEKGQKVIAQVNKQMPRCMGDGILHIDRFDAVVEVDEPIYEMKFTAPSEVEQQIGAHVATLVEDGATLQMGIGGIPNAVLTYLHNHKNLGVHTEMFSEGLIDLCEKGIVNGANKKVNPHKIVSGFAMGTRRLYDFMDDNPEVEMMDIAYVNDTAVIRQNPKVTAINSAIEVDLTGQICADSIGTRMFSGVGGQMDFMRGAALSEGGKPITALPSITNKGISKISPFLQQGAGVVTTRAHARFVVTEYGIADLFGQNLVQRAKALISIAHPMHREALEKEAKERFGRSYSAYAGLKPELV